MNLSPFHWIVVLVVVMVLLYGRRYATGTSLLSSGKPLVTVLELLGTCMLVAIIGSFFVALRVVDHIFLPSAQMRAAATSGDWRSAISRQTRETKQLIKQTAKSGKEKSSPELAAKQNSPENSPPGAAKWHEVLHVAQDSPKPPAEKKPPATAAAAKPPLQSQPRSPPPTPLAGGGSPAAAKPQAEGGPKAGSAKTRPVWVDAPSHVVDGAYQTSITVGPYTTRGECNAKLPEALQESVDKYIEACLDEDAAGRIRLPSDYLHDQLVKAEWEETRQYSVGPMTQLHLLLEFDRQVKQHILEAYRQTLVAGRLWLTGGTLAALLGLLAVLYGYLKWSANSSQSSLS